MSETIKVTYSTIDRFRKARSFKALTGARNFARYWVGKHPEIGSGYAVSSDGVGKIEVRGATLAELFPENTDPPKPWIHVSAKFGDYAVFHLGGFVAAFKTRPEAEAYIATLEGTPDA